MALLLMGTEHLFRNAGIIEKYSINMIGNTEFSNLDKDMGEASSDLLAFFLNETSQYFEEDCKENFAVNLY